jgi:hypothetical protein
LAKARATSKKSLSSFASSAVSATTPQKASVDSAYSPFFGGTSGMRVQGTTPSPVCPSTLWFGYFSRKA